jgi:hypothetical protein
MSRANRTKQWVNSKLIEDNKKRECDIEKSLEKWGYHKSHIDQCQIWKGAYGEVSQYGDVLWIYIKHADIKNSITTHHYSSIDEFDKLMMDLTNTETSYTRNGEAIPNHMVIQKDEDGYVLISSRFDMWDFSK